MSSGDPLGTFDALDCTPVAWVFVAFTSGSVAPVPGDVIWGDTSDENGILEYISVESGTFGGGDAAGYMLLSNLTGVVADWTSGENWTKNTTTAGNDGTLTVKPVDCGAPFDIARGYEPTRDFDPDVNEVVLCIIPAIPENVYTASAGFTVTHKFRATSATTLDMSFKGFFKSLRATDDADTKTFEAPKVNATIDAPTVNGRWISFDIAFSFAEAGSPLEGQPLHYLLMRDAQDSAADDMAGDAELVSIVIKET